MAGNRHVTIIQHSPRRNISGAIFPVGIGCYLRAALSCGGCSISGKTVVVIGWQELQPRVNTQNVVYARLPLLPNYRNLATVGIIFYLSFSTGSAAAQAIFGTGVPDQF